MSGEEEQNKSEAATPHKLEQARKKGTVARGTDLAFLSSLVGLVLFLMLAGADLAVELTEMMKGNFAAISGATDPRQAVALLGADVSAALQKVAFLGITLMVIIVPIEIMQLRGFVFTTEPLKPDFSRLNPAKGFKRLFSVRMLKEALKSCIKFTLYIGLAILAIRIAMNNVSGEVGGARHLGLLLWSEGMRLLIFFGGAAFALAILDQLITRREFAKQMRMSHRELTKEYREREGEPRIKQKRKQLHAEYITQSQGMGKLAGSDMLIVNPEHFAVALAYDAASMQAPSVRARGRNHFALAMKEEAARLNIPMIVDPPLARQLYRSSTAGHEIAADQYREVALHYSRLQSARGGS